MSTAFVVQEIGWNYNDEYFYRGSDGETDDRPVRAFRTREGAEAHRRALEADREGMEQLNPFEFGQSLAAVTSLTSRELARRLTALGLEPPDIEPDEDDGGEEWLGWFEWWQDAGEQLTAEQNAQVWNLLDRIRFYEVLEVELHDEARRGG
jgi:hypothetical protein